MTNKKIERVPRIPHWRYLLYKGEDLTEELLQLKRWLDEEGRSVGLDIEESRLERALRIWTEEPPIRSVVEKMLLENCQPIVIRDVIFSKFKDNIDIEDIMIYQKYFFDTESLNAYDMAKYYEKSGRMHEFPHTAPPVPGRWRPEYAAFKQGGDVEIDMEAAVKHIFTDAFFRAAELGEYGWRGDDKKIKYQNMVLSAYKALLEARKDGKVDLPEAFNIQVWYPETTAVSIEEIDYDMDEDPNAE